MLIKPARLTGKCTQAEVNKLERCVSDRLDAINKELQLQRSGYTDDAQQILDDITLSQHGMLKLVQKMQDVLDESTTGRQQSTDGALMQKLPFRQAGSPC